MQVQIEAQAQLKDKADMQAQMLAQMTAQAKMQQLLQQQMQTQMQFFRTKILPAIKIPSPPSVQKRGKNHNEDDVTAV